MPVSSTVVGGNFFSVAPVGGGGTAAATYASVAAMQADVVPATGTVVTLSGYYAAGDGGGGSFLYSAASSAAADAGTVFAPGSGVGRWLRLFPVGGVDIRWFGAVGDNISHPLSGYFGSLAAAQAVYPHATSLTNEVDWAAIQGAIDMVRARRLSGGTTPISGGTVNVPSGIYLCDQTISLSARPAGTNQARGLTIRGQGFGLVSGVSGPSTIVYTASGTNRFIDARSSYQVVIEKIAIAYSNPAYFGYLVDASHSTGGDTQKLTIRDASLSGTVSVDIATQTQGCKALVFLGNAIFCTFDNVTFQTAKMGIRFRDTDGSYSNSHVVQNCTFTFVRMALVNSAEGCVFVNNGFEGSGGVMNAAYLDDYLNVTASPAITITFDPVAKTITRSSGSWITDRWAVGMVPVAFEEFGGGLNNGTTMSAVASLTATVLTLTTSAGMTAETRTSDCRVYSISRALGVESPTTEANIGNTLTFGGSTITRSSGTWVGDNMFLGQVLSVASTSLNNGTLPRVVAFTPTVLDFTANTFTFSAASKTITRSYGSFITDGFTVGMIPTVSGATNAGTLTAITALTATVMTIAGSVIVDGTNTSGDVYSLLETAFVARSCASTGITFVNETSTSARVYLNAFGGGPTVFTGNWLGDQFRADTWLQFNGVSGIQITGNQFVGNRRAIECTGSMTGALISGNHFTAIQEPMKLAGGSAIAVIGNTNSYSAADLVLAPNAGTLWMAGNTLDGATSAPGDIIVQSVRSSKVTIALPPQQILTAAQAGSPNVGTLAYEITQGGGVTLGIGSDVTRSHIQTYGGPLHINQLGTLTKIGGSVLPNSVLDVAGAISLPFRSTTASTTLTANDSFVDLDATSATVVATLPPASGCAGRIYTVKAIAIGGGFFARVAVAGGETIDGAASPYTLAAANSTVTVVSNGTNWRIKSKF